MFKSRRKKSPIPIAAEGLQLLGDAWTFGLQSTGLVATCCHQSGSVSKFLSHEAVIAGRATLVILLSPFRDLPQLKVIFGGPQKKDCSICVL